MRPKSVKILGVNYDIEYTDISSLNDGKEINDDSADVVVGDINFWRRKIRALDDPDKNYLLATLIHEILHAMGDVFNIDMLNDDDNHDDLDTLAFALGDFILNNPEFLDAFLGNNNAFHREPLHKLLLKAPGMIKDET